MENFKYGRKGITLIAMVVTIVILLILAGVSINMVLGDNGLISKAKEAKNAYEQDALNTEKSFAELYDELQENLGEFPSTEYTFPYLPTGFSRVEGTGLSNGLVIEDSNGNQYVWVEVPKTKEVYPTAGLTLDLNTLTGTDLETAYTKIEDDLHTYTSVYRNGTDFSDTYYPDTVNEGWFESAEEYNDAKNKMLKSVYENGGFYVGRYETGIEGSYRSYGSDYYTLHETTGYTPVIKANTYPYNWVRRTQAKVLAENMEAGDRTSSLIFGVQWDLILVFLHNKGRISNEVLINDSKNIGNHFDNLWNITTLSKYSTDGGRSWHSGPYNKNNEKTFLLTTGANTSFEIMNIYDLAGNVREWTLENGNPCSLRGGSYYTRGRVTISYRASLSTTYCDSDTGGFRVCLY